MNVLIIGCGDIGFHLTRQLSLEKHNLVIVEQDPQKARRADEQLDAMVVEGHGASYRVLRQAKIKDAEIVAAMTNNDEVNLIVCQIAKKLGVPTTIARVRNPEFSMSDFIMSPQELGADLIIHPERETAEAIIRLIKQSSATDVIEFENGKIELLGIRIEQNVKFLRVPLKELGKNYSNIPMRIVAIKRKEHTLIPRGDDILVAGDQIFLVCDPQRLREILKMMGKTGAPVENIMVLGGGLVGQFVARSIGKGINVKIIESNAARSQEIADILPHSLIIHGDGTDLDLLVLEGITDMDAFIAVTGDDETNIISTLVARHLKVPRTIALINKVEYLPITPTIGMDAVVSKQLITVNAVQRYIRQKQVASIATLPGIDAEIIEYIAAADSKITRKKLRDIHFPKHAIVGAVMHQDRLVIPTGETRVLAGDKVVVVTLPQALGEVEKLFK